MSDKLEFQTAAEVIAVLKSVEDLPSAQKGERRRTIYEAGDSTGRNGSGEFYIDYATFGGGSTKRVPLRLIRELEESGIIIRAYPNSTVNAWALAR